MVTQGRNAEYTKRYNRAQTLRLLRAQPQSRAELARKLHLTRATTTVIAEAFLSEGLVEEVPTQTTQTGRNPLLLRLRPGVKYACGVFLNRDGCTVGIADICGEAVCQSRLRFSENQNKLTAIAEALLEMAKKEKITWDKIVGVGVSAPGPLDGEAGRILNPPRFDLWHNTQVSYLLESRLGVPVYLEHNASCLARYNCGKPEAGGSEDFLLLLVDSGIGSGVISRGKILKGAGYFTSELGHTSIDFQGKPCPCGNTGCLEMYAAIPNLLEGTAYHTWKEVVDGLGKETAAEEILHRQAQYLSAGVCNMTGIVSLDTVLLAGDILYGWERLAPIMEECINRQSLRRNALPLRVRPAHTGENARVLAAAEVAIHRYLTV